MHSHSAGERPRCAQTPGCGRRARPCPEQCFGSGPRSRAALAGLGLSAPAYAEEAAANKIPLGGGFAINLDIPETGFVNIVVLSAGLLYLLAPLLSKSMATREKEIQTDIDDAVAKYGEASARLAEAQKAKAQADEVIAETEASISKDRQEFQTTIEAQTKATLDKQSAAAGEALKELQANADLMVEAYIQEQAVKRGLAELQEPLVIRRPSSWRLLSNHCEGLHCLA